MTYRLTGQDLETARGHAAGLPPVQLLWIYDRPVDRAGLDTIHAALRRGRLGRVATPAMLGAAGDRWTTRAKFAPIAYYDDAVTDTGLQDWFATQSRGELCVYGGPAWRLSATSLANGGSAVSLVVSHGVADGRSALSAVCEAVSDTGPNWRYPADGHGRGRLLLGDIAAAVPNLVLAVGAWVGAQIAALRRRGQTEPTPTPAQTPTDSAVPAPTNRITICVPAPDWAAIAEADGGTPSTLALAVVASVAGELGRVDANGAVRLDLPVSVRTKANDHMANALSGIAFSVDTRDLELTALRRTMKQTLVESGGVSAQDRRLWRLLPAISRTRWLRIISTALTSHHDTIGANCSLLGVGDVRIGRIDGTDAVSVAMSMTPRDEYVAGHGGLLRADMLEVDGRVTVRISACHPANPVDAAEFRAAVARVCDRYRLPATYW